MELPNRELRHGLVASYAGLREHVDVLSAPRPLLLPNAEFFPDLFTGDEPSVQRLLDRLLDHSGLADMAIVARFWGETETSCGSGGCGSCATAPSEAETVERLVDAGETWQINVLPAEVAAPVVLTSALCRAIALAVLLESEHRPRALDLDVAIDLAAVDLGYGVLLLEGSHIYRKSCGGPSIARTTVLGPSELALVVALSAAVRGQSLRKVSKHLSATQREALSEATAWADSNPALIRAVQSDPELVARGQFELAEPSSWLARWLRSKVQRPRSVDAAQTIAELEAALHVAPAAVRSSQKPRDPKLEEARRLVEEALTE